MVSKKKKEGTGWRKVWFIYKSNKKNLYKSILIPFVLTAICIIICTISSKEYAYFIALVSESIISVCPPILGFVLSGYALMMGLSDSKVVRSLMKFKPNDKFSLFETLSSTFAIILLVTSITTLAGVLAHVIIEASLGMPVIMYSLTPYWNACLLFVLLFLLFYTVNSIKDIVINIFYFGRYTEAFCSKNEDS